jgi:hypothetical protein
MATKTEVQYLDDTTATATVSLFDKMQAEKYATANGWGTIMDSSVRQTSYAVYAALRRSNQITQGQNFEQWAQTVLDFADISTDAKTADADAPLAGGTQAA